MLRAFSQGHVTHLLRSNHEGGDWAGQFDEALLRGLELLLGVSLSLDQRAQCFLRLSDGGLGFGSASQAAQAAFLGSWALALKEVADSLGVNSWEGFRSRCEPIAATIARTSNRGRSPPPPTGPPAAVVLAAVVVSEKGKAELESGL